MAHMEPLRDTVDTRQLGYRASRNRKRYKMYLSQYKNISSSISQSNTALCFYKYLPLNNTR